MIERLQELKSVAKDGGETPVVINISDHESDMEEIAADLVPVIVRCNAKTGFAMTWRTIDNGNTDQVVRMF